MAGKISGENDEPISEINIVPFVDIILVVLIIFMITTPFIVKPSFNINLPKAASGDETTPSQLNITLTSDGKTMLNGKPSDKEAITKFAVEMLIGRPDTQAIIAADQDVPHGRVVGIIDTVKSAGIKKFAITIDRK